MQSGKTINIMMVAGEISGDMHAAELIAAIRKARPGCNFRFFGIGGNMMEKQGFETIFHVRDTAIMGFIEVLKHLPFFRRVFRTMEDVLYREKPDAVILVDYPGFNLRFAQSAKKAGIRTFYYICPQVWAWNTSRIRKMEESLDLLITIFPFERNFFDTSRLRVEFAGHPLVDAATTALASPVPPDWQEGRPTIAILPGSRRHVISRNIHVMLQAAMLMQELAPDASFIIAAPDAETKDFLESLLKDVHKPGSMEITSGRTRAVLRSASAAMVASGTATIEASLMRCPMIVIYKMPRITYLLGRWLVKIRHIGMVNIIAGREICREFIQDNADPGEMAALMMNLAMPTDIRKTTLAGLDAVNASLGAPGASARAAGFIMEELRKTTRPETVC